VTEDQEDEAECRAHVQKRNEYLAHIRDACLSMAETTERVAEQGGKYRELLLVFARNYRSRANRASEDLGQLEVNCDGALGC